MENIYSLHFQPQKNETDMTENQIKIIEELIKERNYQKAETLLNKLLQVVPDDWQGKLLLGTCKLLQGDIEAAQKIHAEAEAHFESGTDWTEKEKTFWQKYKKWFIYGTIGTALVLGTAAVYAGKVLKRQWVSQIDSEIMRDVYAGPQYNNLRKYAGPNYFPQKIHQSPTVSEKIEDTK